MRSIKANFYGNPNIGLFGFCTNSYCILGTEVPEHKAKQIGSILKVPVHRMNICGTSMIGVFLAGNSNKLLVPSIAFDNELAALRKLGIDFEVIDTYHTALGNNILCTDTGCLLSPEFTQVEAKRIAKALGVDFAQGTLSGIDTVGALGACNSRACAVSRDASEHELKALSVLGVKVGRSSVNMGSQFIRSGVLCNDNGLIVGDMSGGPEIVNLEELLRKGE